MTFAALTQRLVPSHKTPPKKRAPIIRFWCRWPCARSKIFASASYVLGRAEDVRLQKIRSDSGISPFDARPIVLFEAFEIY